MRLAYGTYAMPTVPLEEAIPLLKEIGYGGVELCVGSERFHTLPGQIDEARRKRLRALLKENELGIPALMVIRTYWAMAPATEAMGPTPTTLVTSIISLTSEGA